MTAKDTFSINRALSLLESARDELLKVHLVKSAYDIKQIKELIKLEQEEKTNN